MALREMLIVGRGTNKLCDEYRNFWEKKAFWRVHNTTDSIESAVRIRTAYAQCSAHSQCLQLT